MSTTWPERSAGEPSTTAPDAVPSTIAVRGHPIHPMLVTLPIASLLGLVGTDLAYYATLDPFWARVSYLLAAAGAITGAVAGAAGAIDLLYAGGAAKLPSARIHAGGNLLVVLLAIVNWFAREGDPGAFILSWGLWLSIGTAMLLFITGWAGGELAYRHRIGVIPRSNRDEAIRPGIR